MKITQLLDRPIAYHKVFVTLTGSVKAAIMLSQAMYWQPRAKQSDGWWYKSAEEWEEETGLTRREQEQARKDCSLFLLCKLKGTPATLFWKVDEDALQEALFSQKGESSFDKKVKLDSTKSENINKESETISENTQASDDAEGLEEQLDTKEYLEHAREYMNRGIENHKADKYADAFLKYPVDVQEWCKEFAMCVGYAPTPSNKSDWIKWARECMTAGITRDKIHDVVEHMKSKGLDCYRPQSILLVGQKYIADGGIDLDLR
jgi:hypothetical protein